MSHQPPARRLEQPLHLVELGLLRQLHLLAAHVRQTIESRNPGPLPGMQGEQVWQFHGCCTADFDPHLSVQKTRKLSHLLYLPLRDPGAAARTLRVAAHSRSVRARLLHGLSGRRFSHSWGLPMVVTFTSAPINEVK